MFNIYHAEYFDETRIIRVHLPLGITNPECRTTTRCQPWAMRYCPFEAHLKTMAQPHSAVWLRIAAQNDHMEGWKWLFLGVKMIAFGGENNHLKGKSREEGAGIRVAFSSYWANRADCDETMWALDYGRFYKLVFNVRQCFCFTWSLHASVFHSVT